MSPYIARGILVTLVITTSVNCNINSNQSNNQDDYLREIQDHCVKYKKTITCAKYTLLKYVDDSYFSNLNLNVTSDSSVRLVNITPSHQGKGIFVGESRQLDSDSEITKMFKFVQRRVDGFLQGQGLLVELPEDVRVAGGDGRELKEHVESRKKKDKQSLIFPVLVLLKLFSIKVLLALTLTGVLVIKKALLIAAFFLPGIIASIKAHCKMPQYHVVPYHVEDEHYHHDSGTGSGYGMTGYGSDSKYNHYWDKTKKAYSPH